MFRSLLLIISAMMVSGCIVDAHLNPDGASGNVKESVYTF